MKGSFGSNLPVRRKEQEGPVSGRVIGKGFGCRPEHERSTRYKAGVRKPPMKEPAGEQ
jgi:hypothetical protein